MANGPVVAFMGTRYFANNLTINPADVIRPKAASTPVAYAQDNTEYDVQVGSWVVNGGTDSTSAILNAKITFGGTTLYDQFTASHQYCLVIVLISHYLHSAKLPTALECIILLILLILQGMNLLPTTK